VSRGGTPISNASSREGQETIGTGTLLHNLVREGKSFSGHERHCCFLNLGEGTFADVSSTSGLDFPDDGRAIALTDWDLDGDLDLWIANRNGPQVRFLRNDLKTDNRFLAIRLEGTSCNRDAIGARVEVILNRDEATSVESNSAAEEPHPVRLIKTLRAGEGYLAQSSKWLSFGLGSANEIDEVVVRWPGGDVQRFTSLKPDRHYRLVQNQQQPLVWSPPSRQLKLTVSKLGERKSTDQLRVFSATRTPLPRMDYETLDGQRRVIGRQAADSESRGPILLNLWASWCRPCLAELNQLTRQQQQLRDAGLQVVALSVDRLDQREPNDHQAAQGLIKKLQPSFTTGWAIAETIEKLQLVVDHVFDQRKPLSVPTSVLIDSEGQLAALYRGPVEVDQIVADVALLSDEGRSNAAVPFPGRWRSRHNRNSAFYLVWRLLEQGYLDESVEYIQRHRPLLETHYNHPKLLVLAGNGLAAEGQPAAAVKLYRDALSLNVDYLDARNNLAWILATSPDEELRNGEEAVRLIEVALRSGGTHVSSLLDTLAASYAENGQFDRAVMVAKKAVEKAEKRGDPQRLKTLTERLQLYESGQPYRDRLNE